MDIIFAKILSFERFSAGTVLGNKFQLKHRQCANLSEVVPGEEGFLIT